MSTDTRGGSRTFVRSLNILLKFARLYEFGHVRTAAQFETTWKELRAALDESGGSGLLLGASGNQILLDGVPLGTAASRLRTTRRARAASCGRGEPLRWVPHDLLTLRRFASLLFPRLQFFLTNI